MILLALSYAFVSKEIQNVCYALYAFFFALYTISSYHLWPLLTTVEFDYHAYYIYYIPFSLSSIFFGLFILKSIKLKANDYKVVYILYLIFAIKIVTIICPLVGVNIENIMHILFTKLDVAIYALLTFLVIVETIKKPNLNNYWMVTGLLVLFTSQLLHIFYNLSHWIFLFMFFDILWFGIGLAISYKLAKEEKIVALNEIISIKNTYNNELEHKVQERTEQLKQNLETIAELNNILKDNNITLLKNVQTLALDRMLNKELTFEEFKAQFPDKESCLELLSELKWKGAFECNACGNKSYFFIKKSDPYLRKCTQCGKIHSATTNTLFHNIKFPLEKAFYIIFLATSNKKYSIEQIGEIIALRTATVWSFKKKVEEKMEEKKFAKNKDMTWQDLIL